MLGAIIDPSTIVSRRNLAFKGVAPRPLLEDGSFDWLSDSGFFDGCTSATVCTWVAAFVEAAGGDVSVDFELVVEHVDRC